MTPPTRSGFCVCQGCLEKVAALVAEGESALGHQTYSAKSVTGIFLCAILSSISRSCTSKELRTCSRQSLHVEESHAIPPLHHHLPSPPTLTMVLATLCTVSSLKRSTRHSSHCSSCRPLLLGGECCVTPWPKLPRSVYGTGSSLEA